MNTIRELWEKRLSGELSRNDYRLFASSINSGIIDLCSFLDRSDAQSIEINPTGCLLNLKDGSVFAWDPIQIGSAPNLLLIEGKYEPFETSVLLHLARRANLFIDVGANVGYFAVRLSNANHLLTTVAIEAIPSTAKILCENIALNKIGDRVSVINKAIGSSEGMCQLFVPEVSGHSAASIQDQHPDEPSTVTSIEMTTLNDVLKEFSISNDDLIKLDVEGAEYEVFCGGLLVFEKARPTIFAELLRKWMRSFNSHPNDVIDLLRSFDYSCLQIGDYLLEEIDRVTEDTISTNFLFVQDAIFEELKSCGFVKKS